MQRNLFVALVVSCALCSCRPAGSREETPSVSLPLEAAPADGTAWDFGRLPANATVSHTFSVTNRSGKTIRVTGTHSSCGCTAGKVDREALGPGESAGMTVSFNTSGYRGNVTQFVYVNTDNPEEPVMKFTVTAQIE